MSEKIIMPIFNNRSVNVAFATNENYVPYCATAIQSLICNTSESNYYDIIILERGIEKDSEQKLCSMADNFENISIRTLDIMRFLDMYIIKANDTYPIEVYFRLFLVEALPAYEKIIYLDSDIILRTDIAELFSISINDNCFAGVRDIVIQGQLNGGEPSLWAKKFLKSLQFTLYDAQNYVNSGVLIMNLAEIRNNITLEEMVNVSCEKNFFFIDQDLINFLFRNSIYCLPIEWNVFVMEQGSWGDNNARLAPNNLYKQYQNACENPKILHYASANIKPWLSVDSYKAELFWYYAYKCPHYETILSRYNSFNVRQKLGETVRILSQSKGASKKEDRSQKTNESNLTQYENLAYLPKEKKLNNHLGKIGFVVPWYGENIPGGAEAELRDLVKHLIAAKVELEVLTTCVKQFAESDWGVNYHKPGLTIEVTVPVRRFRVRKRDEEAFDRVNIKLMQGNTAQISAKEEDIFANEMINSPELYDYMRKHCDDYSLFVFVSYMFGTTYHGSAICPQKSVLIPCFHDESYAYLKIFQKYALLAGMIFHAEPEMKLAERILKVTSPKNWRYLGAGIDTEASGNAEAFRKKYCISTPFLLYAGRKEAGKNVPLLIDNFAQYKMNNPGELKLVFVGNGAIDVPKSIKNDVIDLGFVPLQDKYDAYAAATLLCQPSVNESFSIVIMESWLCECPVLVNTRCEVTKDFCIKSNGGLFFSNYSEFDGCVNYLLEHKETADEMGRSGRQYVLDNFAWSDVTKRYISYFRDVYNEILNRI